MAAETVKFIKRIEETTLEQRDPQPNGTTVERCAVIRLEGGVFKVCNFKLSSDNMYTFGDWMFLAEVAAEIKELAFPVKKADEAGAYAIIPEERQ